VGIVINYNKKVFKPELLRTGDVHNHNVLIEKARHTKF
jgi:hypothetical protein